MHSETAQALQERSLCLRSPRGHDWFEQLVWVRTHMWVHSYIVQVLCKRSPWPGLLMCGLRVRRLRREALGLGCTCGCALTCVGVCACIRVRWTTVWRQVGLSVFVHQNKCSAYHTRWRTHIKKVPAHALQANKQIEALCARLCLPAHKHRCLQKLHDKGTHTDPHKQIKHTPTST